MSNNPSVPSSASDFNHFSVSGTEFTEAQKPTPENSDYDIVSNGQQTSSTSGYDLVSDAGFSSAASEGRDRSHSIPPTSPSSVPGNDGPSHPLIVDNLSLKTIDEVAGGSIQRYQQMIISDLKSKRGLAFTAETAIPERGELIGDQLPGYEAMSLGAKFWSWWTRKEKAIFDAQILKEILEFQRNS